MRDKGFIGIWSNSLPEAEKEFRKEFVSLTSEDDREGLYTFFFSRYDDYRVITEVLYSVVYPNTAMFYAFPRPFVIKLDMDLNVLGGNYADIEDPMVMDAALNSKNIESLGTITNSMGECFEAFTLLEPEANKAGKRVFGMGLDVERISVSDEEVVDMSLNFLEHQIEMFRESADLASEDETTVELNENPLANRFYDKDSVVALSQKKPLGDFNV